MGGHGVEGEDACTYLLPTMTLITISPRAHAPACTQLFSEEDMVRQRVVDFHDKRVQSRELQKYWRHILDKRDRSLLSLAHAVLSCTTNSFVDMMRFTSAVWPWRSVS